MLVLTRKDEEGITLDMPDGRRVRIFVEVCGANKAKLCIDAPSDVSVGRLAATPSSARRVAGRRNRRNESKGVHNG